MFFMIGTWPGRKELGIIDGYTVYMVYESLMIFFIPVFKFAKRYYAEKNASTFEIDPETGKAIERGEDVKLNFTDTAQSSGYERSSNAKICMRCKFRTENTEYSHCPMCGNKLVSE